MNKLYWLSFIDFSVGHLFFADKEMKPVYIPKQFMQTPVMLKLN